MRTVTVLSGTLKGKKIPVGDAVISLGRDTDATLQILDDGVSRHHAEIYVVGDMVFVKDLGSTNGSFVNDQKVAETVLRNGDRVRIGTTVMEFEDTGADLKDLENQVDLEVPDEEAAKGKTIELKLHDAGSAKAATREGDETHESRNLELVYQVAKLVGSQTSTGKLLNEVLGLAVKATHADSGFIFLLDPKSGKLDPKASVDKEGGAPGSKISKSIVKRVLDSSNAILSSDAGADSRFSGSDSVVLRKIKSVICAPLMFQEKVNGVLYLHSSQMLTSFDKPELEAAAAIAIQLGSAIGGFLAAARSRKLMSGAIKALVGAMESRDPKMGGHSERVAAYSAHIARELKMPADAVKRVYLAGLLHDVGKIALPPAAKLAGGYKARNEHPVLGEKILGNLDGFQDIIPAVKYHHELYNGSGYPEGLAGDKIPAIARIVCVANAFDNLSSYGGAAGEPASVKQVLLDMGQNANKEYDDKVLKGLLVAESKGTLFQPLNLMDEL